MGAAETGDTVLVSPGRYGENIHFAGKDIVLTGRDPHDASVVAATVIDAGGSAAT